MGIPAALCNTLIGSEIGRLGLNGPEVIEQEAGIGELDAKDRPRVWATIGCRKRFENGGVDGLVDDDTDAVANAVRKSFDKPATDFRSRAMTRARSRIAAYAIAGAAK